MGYWKHCSVAFLTMLIVLTGCRAADDPLPAATPPDQGTAPDTQVDRPVPTVTSERVEGQWDVVRQVQVENRISFAAFLDHEFGITGCAKDDRQIIYTRNGGQTWTESESSPG